MTEEMMSMKEFYQYEIVFSFDRPIKKVSNENGKLSDDKKSFSLNGSLIDVFSEDFNSDIDFKLK